MVENCGCVTTEDNSKPGVVYHWVVNACARHERFKEFPYKVTAPQKEE